MKGAKKVVGTGTTTGIGDSKVGGVAMDIEDHVTHIIANDCVWMGRHVVEEFIDLLLCFFCLFALLPLNLTQTA